MSEIHPIRFPEGVASPDGDVAFVELRSGGISAIDLRSGRDLWTIDLAARPVLVIGDRLIAEDRTQSQDNALQFAMLDITRQGAIDRRIDPIVLPGWVSVSDPDRQFEYDAWTTDGRLVIDWRAESHYSGGAAPPPSVIAEAERAGRGRVRVDLETGSVEHDQIAEPATAPRNAHRRLTSLDGCHPARTRPPSSAIACSICSNLPVPRRRDQSS